MNSLGADSFGTGARKGGDGASGADSSAAGRRRRGDRRVDELDARLIAELREHPRLGLLEISRRLGVARGTVQARLAKLERRGVVTGYGPEIDPSELGHSIQAFVMLELTQGRLAEAVRALEETPEVLEVDAVSGPQDLICRIAARDTEHLQEIVNSLLASDAIRRSTSYVVLSRPIKPRVQPLVDAVGGVPTGFIPNP
ncbi:MAG TPA: Lrp/AsnC family transcriptional regulator [Thermoleophilaceae bacterium]|nr:Lrp/AsnC family transcriptional regulator [Thermoleophilaceae bacterium]